MPMSAGKALTDPLYMVNTYSVCVHRVFTSSGQSGQEGIFLTVNAEFRYRSTLVYCWAKALTKRQSIAFYRIVIWLFICFISRYNLS